MRIEYIQSLMNDVLETRKHAQENRNVQVVTKLDEFMKSELNDYNIAQLKLYISSYWRNR